MTGSQSSAPASSTAIAATSCGLARRMAAGEGDPTLVVQLGEQRSGQTVGQRVPVKARTAGLVIVGHEPELVRDHHGSRGRGAYGGYGTLRLGRRHVHRPRGIVGCAGMCVHVGWLS
jgi:hypothetical protein